MKQRILIIYTGGTIGMIQDHEDGALKPFNFDKILEEFPEIKRFNHQIESVSFSPPIDSSDVNIEIWKKIAETIYKNYQQFDGFVVLHGTDTMSYSASAISFMLENLQKPVIFTGSQLPIGMLRTDGKENLITAIEIAATQKNGKAIVPEVAVLFEDKLMRGNRTTKHNSEDFDAFHSYNYGNLATIGIHIKYHTNRIKYQTNQLFQINTEMENKVAIIKLYPSTQKEVISNILNTKDLKGIVLETYGAGNAMTSGWFLDEIKKAIEKDILILNVSQCRAGSVNMSMYANGKSLLEIGVIDGKDMTTESAITKLMFILGKKTNTEEAKKYFNLSLKGEITV